MDNHGHWTGSFDCKTLVAAILNHPSHLKPSTTVTVRLAFLSLSSGWRVYQIETVHSLYLYCVLCLCSHTFISWSVYQIETIHRFALPRFFQNTLRAKSSSPRLVNTSKQRPHSKHAVNMTIIVHYLEAMRLLTHQADT